MLVSDVRADEVTHDQGKEGRLHIAASWDDSPHLRLPGVGWAGRLWRPM